MELLTLYRLEITMVELKGFYDIKQTCFLVVGREEISVSIQPLPTS